MFFVDLLFCLTLTIAKITLNLSPKGKTIQAAVKQIITSLNVSFASNKNMKFEVRHVKWRLLKGALYEPQVSLANVTWHPPMGAMVPGAHMKPHAPSCPSPDGVPPSALAPGLQQKAASKQRPASRLHYLPIFPATIWGPLLVFPAYVLAHALPPPSLPPPPPGPWSIRLCAPPLAPH